jgi:hypothetical protein
MRSVPMAEIKLQVQEELGDLKSINLGIATDLAERLDFLDIQILRKFYVTGKEFPYDTEPFCFPILFREMKTNLHLKIGIEALRKRLNNLVRLGLILKIRQSNPTNYVPAKGLEQMIRAIITKFFLINGVTKFF